MQNFGGANKTYYGQYQIGELVNIDFRGCCFFLGGLKFQLLLNHSGKGSTLEKSGNFSLLFNAYFGKRCHSLHFVNNLDVILRLNRAVGEID